MVLGIGGPDFSESGDLAAGTIAWTETTGLAANTAYTRKVCAFNSTCESPGSSGQTRWTLSVPPAAGSVTPDKPMPLTNDSIAWTAAGGFGAGAVQYYRHAWDQNATHAWTGAEAQWSSGTLVTSPTSAGVWYLHIQGCNGENVANGSYDYAVTASEPVMADFDRDGDVDGADFGVFAGCYNGAGNPIHAGCDDVDFDGDQHVDGTDYSVFASCYNGSGNPPVCLVR